MLCKDGLEAAKKIKSTLIIGRAFDDKKK